LNKLMEENGKRTKSYWYFSYRTMSKAKYSTDIGHYG
jgi:hypothetical protein